MQRSQDLFEAYQRMYHDLTQGAPLVRFLAASADVTGIGTDPTERWADRETFLRAAGPQLEAFGQLGAQYIPQQAAAWTEQDVGWVIDQPTIRLHDGRAVQLRVTSIFRREDGDWKLVHQHSSIGVPNEAVEAFRGV
jgi:SnoaL-like domain